MRKTVGLGVCGLIGSHLVPRQILEGYRVRFVDLNRPEYSNSDVDDFIV